MNYVYAVFSYLIAITLFSSLPPLVIDAGMLLCIPRTCNVRFSDPCDASSSSKVTTPDGCNVSCRDYGYSHGYGNV
jgi:hypothetical protein